MYGRPIRGGGGIYGLERSVVARVASALWGDGSSASERSVGRRLKRRPLNGESAVGGAAGTAGGGGARSCGSRRPRSARYGAGARKCLIWKNGIDFVAKLLFICHR